MIKKGEIMSDMLRLFWTLDLLGCKPLLRGDYVVLPKIKYKFNSDGSELVAVEKRI